MAEDKENSHDLHIIAERLQELYNAIMGPRLMKKVGLMNRVETSENNINFLTQKISQMEDKIMAELNSIKMDNAKSSTKLNIIWTIIGIVGGTGVTLIFEFIAKK